MSNSMHLRHFLPILALILAGCEKLGLDTAATREADGKAIGGACRHAGRALEDCYLMNPKASKSAVFSGWREFDVYMRENKLDVIRPEMKPQQKKSRLEPKEAEDSHKDDAKDGGKDDAKHGAFEGKSRVV